MGQASKVEAHFVVAAAVVWLLGVLFVFFIMRLRGEKEIPEEKNGITPV